MMLERIALDTNQDQRDLEDMIVAALDGTHLDEWIVTAAGGRCHLIMDRPNGERLELSIAARRLK
jgi:hypothetical protein